MTADTTSLSSNGSRIKVDEQVLELNSKKLRFILRDLALDAGPRRRMKSVARV